MLEAVGFWKHRLLDHVYFCYLPCKLCLNYCFKCLLLGFYMGDCFVLIIANNESCPAQHSRLQQKAAG